MNKYTTKEDKEVWKFQHLGRRPGPDQAGDGDKRRGQGQGRQVVRSWKPKFVLCKHVVQKMLEPMFDEKIHKQIRRPLAIGATRLQRISSSRYSDSFCPMLFFRIPLFLHVWFCVWYLVLAPANCLAVGMGTTDTPDVSSQPCPP